MIEDFLIGLALGFSLPFLIRFREEIMEYLNLRRQKKNDD